MGRGAAKFTEADIRRAMKVAKERGAASIEIKPDGSILVPLSPTHTEQEESEPKSSREIVL